MTRKSKNDGGDYAIEKRWTPALAKAGFTPIVQPFLEHHAALNITPAEALLVVHLMSYKWDAKAPFPSMLTLAQRLGCSERYVRKLCGNLEAVGYLKRYQRPGMSNQFDLAGLFHKLEKHVAKVEASKPIPLQHVS